MGVVFLLQHGAQGEKVLWALLFVPHVRAQQQVQARHEDDHDAQQEHVVQVWHQLRMLREDAVQVQLKHVAHQLPEWELPQGVQDGLLLPVCCVPGVNQPQQRGLVHVLVVQ